MKHEFGNYRKVKKALLKGGIVFAPRRYGKTRAMLEILNENPKAVIVTCNHEMRKLMEQDYFDRYRSSAVGRILTADGAYQRHIDRRKEYDVYVDEWYWAKYSGHFKAAVTSFPDRIQVIKPTTREAEHIKTTMGKQYPNLNEFGIYE